jgi:ubiquinone/menaquinone biosynthesis C-methylase UbiE
LTDLGTKERVVARPEEMAKRIFDERAAHYVTSTAHTDPQVLASVVELSSPDPTRTALDVGTGTGHTAFALSPHVARVVGVDLTPGMLAEAEKVRSQRGIMNVEFMVADVHELPFKDGSFHLVTCRRAAHHFSDIALALREMRRVLCTGGLLVVDDRSVPEDDFVDACMNTLDRYHDESHVRQYRVSEWRGMMEELGFRVEHVVPYTRHLPLTSLTKGVSEENKRKIYDTLERLSGDQRKSLNLTDRDGQAYINHWYLTIAVRKT